MTPEGKAKASRNALKHGLCAMEHLVLEDEVPDDLEELIETVAEEIGATTEIEHRLARRLAIAFWKSERADKIETALFDAAPKIRPPHGGYKWEEADPLTTFDVKRFNAIRSNHAQQGREIGRCLKELPLLRRETWRARTNPKVGQKTNPGARHRRPTTMACRTLRPQPRCPKTNPATLPAAWSQLPRPWRARRRSAGAAPARARSGGAPPAPIAAASPAAGRSAGRNRLGTGRAGAAAGRRRTGRPPVPPRAGAPAQNVFAPSGNILPQPAPWRPSLGL